RARLEAAAPEEVALSHRLPLRLLEVTVKKLRLAPILPLLPGQERIDLREAELGLRVRIAPASGGKPAALSDDRQLDVALTGTLAGARLLPSGGGVGGEPASWQLQAEATVDLAAAGVS